jgi:hypothetical protein
MSLLDKVVAAVTPEPSAEEMAEVRAKARAASGGSGWLAQILDHHEQIEAAFAAVGNADSATAQRAAQKRLATLLTGHSNAEEAVIYPAMALTDQKAHSTLAYTQQSAAKVQTAALNDLEPMTKEYLDKLEHLRVAVRQHVYQEEREWFPTLRERDSATQASLSRRYRDEFERYMGAEAGNR